MALGACHYGNCKETILNRPNDPIPNFSLQNKNTMTPRTIFDKIGDVAIDDVKAIAAFFTKKTPELAIALHAGYNITQKILTVLMSQEGIVIENLVASTIPQAQSWTIDVEQLASEMGNCMLKVQGFLPAMDGIAAEYCARIVGAIEGGVTELNDLRMEVRSLFTKA